MVNKSAQSFGTGFLILTAVVVVLLNIALVTDLHAYAQPPCSTGEELGEAGLVVDVSEGHNPGICQDN